MKNYLRYLLILMFLQGAAPLHAHDMFLSVWAENNVLQGVLTYSDHTLAEGHPIQILNLTAPDHAELMLLTGSDGLFKVPVLSGHHYEIRAEGDEGHTIRTQFHAAKGGWPPIYVILAVLLLLSLAPALWLRRREHARESSAS